MENYDYRDESGLQQQNERKNYYFLLADAIVAVDITTWETKVVRESVERPGLFQIRDNMFAWVAYGDQKTVVWENLETGETGRYLTDAQIGSLLITDRGIIAGTRDEVILFGYDGERREVDWTAYGEPICLMEGNGKIYGITYYNGIGVIDGDFTEMKEIEYDNPYGFAIFAARCTENGLEWYTYHNETHIFRTDCWSFRKYTEAAPGRYEECPPNCHSFEEYTGTFFVGVRTKHYELLQDRIHNLRKGQEICGFPRKTSRSNRSGQVVALYDKDIFISVGARKDEECMNGEEEFLQKIDLGKERQPVRLKVDLQTRVTVEDFVRSFAEQF